MLTRARALHWLEAGLGWSKQASGPPGASWSGVGAWLCSGGCIEDHGSPRILNATGALGSVGNHYHRAFFIILGGCRRIVRESWRPRSSSFSSQRSDFISLPCSFSFLRSLFSTVSFTSPRWVSDHLSSSQRCSPLRLEAAMASGLFSPTTTAGPNSIFASFTICSSALATKPLSRRPRRTCPAKVPSIQPLLYWIAVLAPSQHDADPLSIA